MNSLQLLYWSATWTIVGSILLVIAQFLASYFRSASTRHLAWTVAFGTTLIFPFLPGAFNCPAFCSTAPGNTSGGVASALLATWIFGFAWNFGRAIMAWRRVNQWWKNSATFHPPDNFPENIRIRISGQADPVVPITWGFRESVILLPRSAAHWPRERVSTLLWHELGHIRRFDNAVQMITLFICAIHWFNPLFWRSAQQMETEAELAADDFAILRGVKASSYAADLLAVASELTASNWKCPIAHTALINDSSLERRLKAIIDPNASRGAATLLTHAVAITLMGAVAIALSLLTPQFKSPSPNPTCLPTDSVPTIHNSL